MKWKLLSFILPAGIFFSLWIFLAIPVDSAPPDIASETASAAVTAKEPEASEASLFAGYENYNAEYEERYEAYQKAKLDLDAGDVLWRVNAGLDSAPYILAAETGSKDPLLVNKRHKLPDGYEPEELVEIHSGIMVTPGTEEAFRRMRNAAMRDKVYIEAALGYRSFERQQELFDTEEYYSDTKTAENQVARPGFSEHNTGRALHIIDRDYTFDGFEKTPEYEWLVGHCADYGFILRYGMDNSDITGFDYEPYHFTFVGRDIALEMKNLRMETLEEYVYRGLGLSGSMPIDDRIMVVLDAENDISPRVRERLEDEDIRVTVSRDIENDPNASAFISIVHSTVAGDAVGLFVSDAPESRGLAELVHNRLLWSGLSAENRGVCKDDRLALTPQTDIPAVCIEIPGTYNPAGLENNAKIADAVSDAVIAYLGLRTMYLTFDDGPSAKNTPEVLDILKEKGVKATFFVIGEMAEANPELIKRIAGEGHAIGIHCDNHDYKRLYESVESFKDDFYRARKTIEEITGIAPVIYRFPGGSVNEYNKGVNKQIIDEMDKLGFVYFDWNISAEDASDTAKSGGLLNNIKKTPRYRYAVLLMHDAYPYIAGELNDVINSFSDYKIDIITSDKKPVQFTSGEK